MFVFERGLQNLLERRKQSKKRGKKIQKHRNFFLSTESGNEIWKIERKRESDKI